MLTRAGAARGGPTRARSLPGRRARFCGWLVLAVALAQAAFAQETRATGLRLSNWDEFAALPQVPVKRGFVALDRVDLSDRLPGPADQGKLGTCAAWATVYAAGSYTSRVQYGDPRLTLSPSYVFNHIDHGSPCEGTDILLAAAFLTRYGSPTIAEFPETRFCESQSSEDETRRYTVNNAYRIALAPYNDDGSRKVKTLFDDEVARELLSEGLPIVIGMRTTDDLLVRLQAGQIYQETSAGDPSRRHDRHAITLVGYDNARQAFRFINSWGRDWGDGGYGWIGYASARSEIEEAIVLVPDRDPPKPGPDPGPQPNPRPQPSPVVDNHACSSVKVTHVAEEDVARGFVENESEREQLENRLAASAGAGRKVRVEVDVRPWPQCEVLLTLGGALVAPDHPRLATLDGRRRLKIGEPFGFALRAPNYPAFLYLIYLQADGLAVNLLPRRGLVRTQTEPGAVIRIGDPGLPGPRFHASPPTGDETVIAIASRSPIGELEALEQSGGRYFRVGYDEGDAGKVGDRRVLTAIETALVARPLDAGAGREISADAVFLSIEP